MNCAYYNLNPVCCNCLFNNGKCYIKGHYEVILLLKNKEDLINDFLFVVKWNNEIAQYLCAINNYFPQYADFINKISVLM